MPSERYCRMVSGLSQRPILGRVDSDRDEPHTTSEEEFATLMRRTGFNNVRIAGYAPNIDIGPERAWIRPTASSYVVPLSFPIFVGDKGGEDR